jgi:hypothetical protein
MRMTVIGDLYQSSHARVDASIHFAFSGQGEGQEPAIYNGVLSSFCRGYRASQVAEECQKH